MKLTLASAGNTEPRTSTRSRMAGLWRPVALAIVVITTVDGAYAQEATTVRADIQGADTEKTALEEKVISLEKANRALEDRVLALEGQNRALNAKADHWEKRLQIARTAGRQLSFSMARRVLWNVTRHIAGMSGTSIPYVGAGVSVAMTAVDVQQGCESLKELNVMNREMALDAEDESKVCGLSVPTKDQVIASVVSDWKSAYATARAYNIPELPPLPPAPALPSGAEMYRLVTAVVPALPNRPW